MLNDMMCHSLEVGRFLLTKPGAPRSSLKVRKVSAQIASLKWSQPGYAQALREAMGADVDYARRPAEDFARALGPEYSFSLSSLETGAKLFLSRKVKGQSGEDLVEKQNAEQGLMPVVGNESAEYGYEGENRYFCQQFLEGRQPELYSGVLPFETGRKETSLSGRSPCRP